jgi:class 3 adenylate cyclase
MSTKAVLLVADISGFTKFMRQHAVATSHAKQIIVRLLKALMHVAEAPLKIAELEGDAVFFYAASEGGEEVAATAARVKNQVINFFSTFNKEVEEINRLQTCSCDACDQVSALKLKQVLHVGNVEVEQIERFEKLFGVDVILVHRMLKNTLPSREYVMMSAPMYDAFGGFFDLEPERRKERFEGLGEVDVLVFYPQGIAKNWQPEMEKPSRPSLLHRMAWRFRISVTFMLELLGSRRSHPAKGNLSKKI